MDLNFVTINNLEVSNDVSSNKEYDIKRVNRNTINKSEVSEEEYKQQLINDVAQIIGTRKKKCTKLKKILGDNYKIWTDMRSTTIKKLMDSIAANDLLQNLSTTMRLTATEWLLVDLILVHEEIEFVNFGNLDATCFRDLFELVKEYRVEILTGKEMAEAWIHLALQYNSRGRECSPMLLQLRWYQLKMLSREQVYKPDRLLHQNKKEMLIQIATKYQKIITKRWSTWSELIQQKHVILPEEFVVVLKEKGNWMGLEARVGWYLNVKEVISRPETKEPEIIEIESDDDINEILRKKAEDFVNISQEKVNNIGIRPTLLVCDDIAKKSLHEKSKQYNNADQSVHKHVIHTSITNNAPICCDSDDEIDQILQKKVNLMSIELAKNSGTSENIIEDGLYEVNKVKNSYNKVENSIIVKETDNQQEGFDDIDFNNKYIEFLDYGIEVDEERDQNMVVSRTDSSCKIDRKLLMNTRVNLKQIDSMEVFKFIEYESVNDKRVIDNVELESRHVAKCVSKGKDTNNFREQTILGPDQDDIPSDNNIRLLQNPKKRHYQSEQLLNVPNLNSQKKNITPDFLTFMTNKIFLKESRPLTLDFHKEFENKPVNGTMFLERSHIKSSKGSDIVNKDNNKQTIIPPSMTHNLTLDENMQLAEHVRDRIAITNHEDNLHTSAVAAKLHVKSSRVINLPDKDQIRLLNQSLLTAEITPRISNIHTVSHIKSNQSSESPKITKTALKEPPTKRSNMKNESSESPKIINGSSKELLSKRLKVSVSKLSSESPIILNSYSTALSTKRFKASNESSELPIIIDSFSKKLPIKRLKASNRDAPKVINSSSEESPTKKIFKKIIESCSSTADFYCCWAREKIVSIRQNLDPFRKKHMCITNCCTCCCRPDLDILLAQSTNPQNVKDNSPMSNIVIMNISQNIKKKFMTTYKTNAGYVNIGVPVSTVKNLKVKRHKSR